jgi:1,4-dihydroxy-2-naphthoate octaprenyltransferase
MPLRASGARSLAMALGFQRSYALYLALLTSAYVFTPAVLLIAISQQHGVDVSVVATAGVRVVKMLDLRQVLEVCGLRHLVSCSTFLVCQLRATVDPLIPLRSVATV